MSACAGSGLAATPPLSRSTAQAVADAYNSRIAVALDQADAAGIDVLEGGDALAVSQVERRFATVAAPASSYRHQLAGGQSYVSPSSAFPQWFVSSAPYALDHGQVEYSLFERSAAGRPWLKTIRTMSTAHVLAQPVQVHGAAVPASSGEIARVKTAVSDLGRYLETGRDRGHLDDVLLAQDNAEYFWARVGVNSDWVTGAVSCDGYDGAVHATMRTRDGRVDALGSLRCHYREVARPGHGLELDQAERQWGITRTTGLRGDAWDEVKQFMLSVSPDGSAQVIAYDSTMVNLSVY